jgi:hypothetical protein
MWILAIVLLGIFGAIGFFSGAVRTAFLFLGTLIGAIAGIPAGHALQPLMGKVGIKNPVWQDIFPVPIAFIIIMLVVFGIGFAVHHKIAKIYKFTRDEVDRIRWERMNKASGVGLGFLTSLVFFFLIGAAIYSGGYLTAQLSNEEADTAIVKFMNQAREDMHTTGLDRAMAALAPASGKFYEVSDVLGLLYKNPLLQARLAHYPPFFAIAQRSEIQEIGTDKEYTEMLFGKASVSQIIAHQRTQGILGNADLMSQFLQTDLADLQNYLRTGKSKYDDQKLIGVWALDKDAVLTNLRKANPDIKANQMNEMKKIFDALTSMSMEVAPDNKVFFKTEIAAPAAPAAAAAQTPAPVVNDPYARMRGRQGAPAVPKAAVPVAAAPQGPAIPKLTGEGAWKEQNGQYVITITPEGGKSMDLPATVKEDEVLVTVPGLNLVFTRQEV